jgi:3-deoxy-7-phosphoheptulonate synthase
MIVVLKKNISEADLEALQEKLRQHDCSYLLYENGEPILRIQTKQNILTNDFFLTQPGVANVYRITPAYDLAAKKTADHETTIPIGDRQINSKTFTIIAGPCAVESEDQLLGIAHQLAQFGVRFLRGGAFKPRTSPYSFQGLGEDGLKLLRKAANKYDMKVVTEAVSSSDVDLVAEYTDVIQIGTRNMQNFRLLKKAGKQKKPVLLKRGMNATLEEFMLAAEYVLQEGNSKIILCERGIRTFETATRNTLDISAVPLIKQLSHLPIVVDPSHASGKRSLILPLSRAALAAGADGVMIEVHNQAEHAKSDGPQSLNFNEFDELRSSLKQIAEVLGKQLQ